MILGHCYDLSVIDQYFHHDLSSDRLLSLICLDKFCYICNFLNVVVYVNTLNLIATFTVIFLLKEVITCKNLGFLATKLSKWTEEKKIEEA